MDDPTQDGFDPLVMAMATPAVTVELQGVI
jgi:hypothetical protein